MSISPAAYAAFLREFESESGRDVPCNLTKCLEAYEAAKNVEVPASDPQGKRNGLSASAAEQPVQKCDHAKTWHHPYLTNAQLDDIHERMNHEVSREEICKIADLLETRHLLITQRVPERESCVDKAEVHRLGLLTIARWTITDVKSNMDAANMQSVARDALSPYEEEGWACQHSLSHQEKVAKGLCSANYPCNECIKNKHPDAQSRRG